MPVNVFSFVTGAYVFIFFLVVFSASNRGAGSLLREVIFETKLTLIVEEGLGVSQVGVTLALETVVWNRHCT